MFDRQNALNLATLRYCSNNVRSLNVAKIRILFDIVRSAFLRAHTRRFAEDDNSTVGALARMSRGFYEGDSGGTANVRKGSLVPLASSSAR